MTRPPDLDLVHVITDRIRVVVVDDALDIRILVRMILTNDGRFEVVGEAADGVEALEVVGDTEPDLVLMDLAMPHMDGLEALSEIRRRYRVVPIVIILTSFDAGAAAQQAADLGAVGYLNKVMRPNELAQQVFTAATAGLAGVG